jgi:DNA processing protein
MTGEMQARVRLFAAIEGGSQYWCDEIKERGALETLDRFTTGGYDDNNHGANSITNKLLHRGIDQLLEEIATSGGELLLPDDLDWPTQLDDLAAPPIALILKGNRGSLPKLAKSLSIVGTRNPSQYGIRIAGDFAAGSVDHDWAIISGGAYGIDSASHKSALISEGITVAVLAGGLHHNYPAGNQRLFEEIQSEGLLISEVMPFIHAEPFRFLIRNRIIAALSKGTVVIEAAFRSGSLRTARDAADLFRLVMAVPGPITSPTSDGCHRLISERSAELVSSIADVMELVNPLGAE